MLGKNGSAIKYITALSPRALAAAGSTNASNFAGFEMATMILTVGSAASGVGFTVKMERSGTSDGTYAAFGASLPGVAALTGNGTFVRSFTLDSSATWYRVAYDNNNGASVIPGVLIALQAARAAPITQDSNTTVYSDVLGG